MQREGAVGGVLERQASADEDLSEAEGFVIERLKVPEQWVYRAKVCVCVCIHMYIYIYGTVSTKMALRL